MTDQAWWVFAGILAWSFVIDATTLFAASGTLRFAQTASGFSYFVMRGVAAIVAAVVLPVVVANEIGLADNEVLLIFAAPIVSLAILELVLGRIAQPGAPATDFLGLIANLRAKAIEDARRMADEAMYNSDLKLMARLAARYSSDALFDSLLNLLHTKMTSLKDARTRMGILLDGISHDEEPRRKELATEIVKIDRVYGRNMARAVRAGQIAAIPSGTS